MMTEIHSWECLCKMKTNRHTDSWECLCEVKTKKDTDSWECLCEDKERYRQWGVFV